jgi:glycosyltransferase involved in cell wall biosynthesis
MNQYRPNKNRIAAFGFRSIPMIAGSAGADKFASEFFPRLVKHGYSVTAYNRVYPNQTETFSSYKGVRIHNLRTFNRSGLDTLWHSMKSTIHILRYDTGDIIHIQNGGNSIWAVLLRLFGKSVVVSQDGLDWKRDKWPWYGKLYLKFSTLITAHLPNRVIFDNVFAKKVVETIYNKTYDFIPFGSEVTDFSDTDILERLDLKKNEYFLFIGRFIPDKGLHYLLPAFKKISTDKKIVIVGGSPNPSEYERRIKSYQAQNIIFPGFIYGNDSDTLINNCFCYIQPSDVEGLSPVLLQVMGFGKPIICSDIQENIYVVKNTALSFTKGDSEDLAKKLLYATDNPHKMNLLGEAAIIRAKNKFTWAAVTERHIKIFNEI